MPTFMVFKQGKIEDTIKGADPRLLQKVISNLAKEAQGAASGSGSSSGDGWRKGELPRGYNDVTDEVDVKGLELLNADSDFGTVRVLVDGKKPSGLGAGKEAAASKDWVESDTDEQLMLFMPFNATIKAHTIQVHFTRDDAKFIC